MRELECPAPNRRVIASQKRGTRETGPGLDGYQLNNAIVPGVAIAGGESD
jgi:hypothetical protein